MGVLSRGFNPFFVFSRKRALIQGVHTPQRAAISRPIGILPYCLPFASNHFGGTCPPAFSFILLSCRPSMGGKTCSIYPHPHMMWGG